MNNILVFLGGTCPGYDWRADLTMRLPRAIEVFNPIVDDWTEEAQAKERVMRQEADVRVYTLTPAMTGVYSVAEVVEDACMAPESTVLCVLGTADEWGERFSSIEAVQRLVSRHGVPVLGNIGALARHLVTVWAGHQLQPKQEPDRRDDVFDAFAYAFGAQKKAEENERSHMRERAADASQGLSTPPYMVDLLNALRKARPGEVVEVPPSVSGKSLAEALARVKLTPGRIEALYHYTPRGLIGPTYILDDLGEACSGCAGCDCRREDGLAGPG